MPRPAKRRAAGYVPVSKGWLKASHREKDETRSTPTRPFYTHTNPQPLMPGTIYQFDIEVLPISYVFKKGHRIRLEIAPTAIHPRPTACSRIPITRIWRAPTRSITTPRTRRVCCCR